MSRLRAMALAAFSAGCGSGVESTPPPTTVDLPGRGDAPAAQGESAAPQRETLSVRRRTLAVDAAARCLVDAGSLYCWGGGMDHEAKPPITATVPPMPIDGVVTSVDIGPNHGCAVTEDGRVFCWGDNATGNLGAGSPDEQSATPLAVLGVDDAVTVAIGGAHSCALRRGGAVSCWGANRSGQGGHDTAYTQAARRLVRAVEVEAVEDALGIAAGETFSCARDGAGIQCWGGSFYRHHQAPNPRPARLEELGTSRRFDAAGNRGCTISTTGSLRCWTGGLFNSRLGHDDAAGPVPLVGVTDIAVDDDHACATTPRGVHCWGLTQAGRLGRDDVDAAAWEGAAPGAVVGAPENPDELAAGGGLSCARTADHVHCWGKAPWRRYGGDALTAVAMPIR